MLSTIIIDEYSAICKRVSISLWRVSLNWIFCYIQKHSRDPYHCCDLTLSQANGMAAFKWNPHLHWLIGLRQRHIVRSGNTGPYSQAQWPPCLRCWPSLNALRIFITQNLWCIDSKGFRQRNSYVIKTCAFRGTRFFDVLNLEPNLAFQCFWLCCQNRRERIRWDGLLLSISTVSYYISISYIFNFSYCHYMSQLGIRMHTNYGICI